MIELKIIEVFKNSGLTRVEFADKLQISNAILSHLASGRNKASLDLVISILNYFPDISADWLILNKGEMLRSVKDNSILKSELDKQVKKIMDTSQLLNQQVDQLKNGLEELK